MAEGIRDHTVAHKFSVFEGGIRVPSLIRYPGKIASGESRDQFMTSCDWLPTLCRLCEVPPPQVHLDGVDISDVLLNNASTPRETFYWQFGQGAEPQWAMRKGKWKLIGNPRDTSDPEVSQKNGGRLKEKYFLVDLESDIGERNNLANQKPEIAAELMKMRETLVSEF